ncbi:MAG: hypothetical protein ACR2RE_09070, partial [Geminicoccaceae bacterium]
YDTYHVVVGEGSYARGHRDAVMQSWNEVVGQKVIYLSDHTKLAEVVVSAIQMAEGANLDDVASSWSGDTSVVVADAVANIVKGNSAGGGPALNY